VAKKRVHEIAKAQGLESKEVLAALKSAGIVAETIKLTYIPQTTVSIADEATASQVIRLCDALEDCDDVQSVHANFDIPEEVLGKLSV